MTHTRSITDAHTSKKTDGDIADWLACVSSRDEKESGAFRKTLNSLLAG